MKPRRFFAEGEPLSPGERLLAGKIARHLARVLRLGVGERIVLFDGSGCEFPAEILEVGRRGVCVRVGPGKQVDRESPLRMRVGLGLCQPATMDLIIQKVTELGVTQVVPVRTERAQRWLSDDKAASRQRRWERIAREAARQSGRNRVPGISPPAEFSEVLSQGESGVKFMFWEEEEHGTLKELLARKTEVRDVYVLLGPEGGFSPKEAEQAACVGFQTVSLGRRLLRTDTAAIAAVSLLQYELGDLGVLP